MSGQLHIMAALSLGKEPLYPLYPLDKRVGRPQSWCGHSGEEKNSQPLLGLEPAIIQPVAQCYKVLVPFPLGLT